MRYPFLRAPPRLFSRAGFHLAIRGGPSAFSSTLHPRLIAMTSPSIALSSQFPLPSSRRRLFSRLPLLPPALCLMSVPLLADVGGIAPRVLVDVSPSGSETKFESDSQSTDQ